jgi:hypothetical protein
VVMVARRIIAQTGDFPIFPDVLICGIMPPAPVLEAVPGRQFVAGEVSVQSH